MIYKLIKQALLICCLLNSQPIFGYQLNKELKADTVLNSRINQLIDDFEGDVGIYVHHFNQNTEVAINADDLFPTASMIKVPIMLALFDKIEKGQYQYNQKLTYVDSLFYSSEDILGSFKANEEIELSKLIMLMITMSDNTASLWCQQLAGTGTTINDWLEAEGFVQTKVNSRTEGRKTAWEEYGWGQTTPKEIAKILKKIYDGQAVSKSASEEMIRVLGSIYWRSEALSQIPSSVATASKQGAVSQSRSEVVLVNAPNGTYLFSIITKNQKDTSWDYDNAGYQLIRDVSKLLWDYFEPNNPYDLSLESTKWNK